jgi:hypothetical protein
MTLLMQAASTSGKFIEFPQAKRCYVPEDSRLQIKLVALKACEVILSNRDRVTKICT